MRYEPEHAWKWRLRAEEIRTRAEMTKDPVARQTFLALAEAWERKAETVERAPWDDPLKSSPAKT